MAEDAGTAHTDRAENAIHRVWATFIDPALEAQYRESRQADEIRQARIYTTTLIAVSVLAVFVLRIPFWLPEHPSGFRSVLFIQSTLIALLAGCLAALHLKPGRRTVSICAPVALGGGFLTVCATSIVQNAELGQIYDEIYFFMPVLVFLCFPVPLMEKVFLMAGILICAVVTHVYIIGARFHDGLRIDSLMLLMSVFFCHYTRFIDTSSRREFIAVRVIASTTEKLLGEIELRKTSEFNLEEQSAELKEQSAELKESLRDLELANQSKGRFLASMSHELRTPMTAVLGYAELLRTPDYGPLNETQAAYVDYITAGGKHLIELINEVLDIAKIDAGAADLACIEVPVKDVVDDAVGSMAPQFDAKHLKVTVAPIPAGWVFLADKRRTKQILLNLLSNAVKYTPDGGQIDIEVRDKVRGFYTVTIRDTGIGIAPENQRRIFFEFEQADRSRDEALGGIGLGLALTRRLVSLHNGEIGVDSVVGKGSAFWFTLPAGGSGAPVALRGTPGDVRRSPVPSGRILIVEDNEKNRMLLREILTVQGHEIHEAANGAEAVEIARAMKLDLILMDIQMPVMNGLDATRAIRAIEACKRLPIVALTASADAERTSECLHAGCVAVLGKPIDMTALNAILEQYLSPAEQCQGVRGVTLSRP